MSRRSPYRYVPVPAPRVRRCSTSVTVRRWVSVVSLVLAGVFGGAGGVFLALLLLAVVGRVFYSPRGLRAQVQVARVRGRVRDSHYTYHPYSE